MMDVAELGRFESKYIKSPGGCWLWQGPLDKDGYGMFYLRRRNRRAHRAAWFSRFGEIPKGMVVDHVCGVRNCVNPSHLRLQTPRQNALENSRGLGAVNAQKVHCSQGHKYDRIYGGQRYCSTCERAKRKRLSAKWRAEDSLNV